MFTRILHPNWILLLILLLAAGLRLWNIGSYPIHLTPDEAALGYNAYSILQTGKDEYGVTLPVIFKSFGDYKPGLYVYLSIPFVATLGLTEMAVRLPSAIAGVVAVWLVYRLAALILEKTITTESKRQVSRWWPYLAALVFALNPWHIHFSRAAWESNVSVTMMIAVVYLFVRAMELREWKSLTSAVIVASLSLWMYQGAKMGMPLLVFSLLIVYWQKFWKLWTWKQIVLVAVLGIIIAMPVIMTFFTGKAGRLTVFSILNYRRPTTEVEETILRPGNLETTDLAFTAYHGEWLATGTQLLRRYFNYFSGRYLFFEGDWMHPHMSSPYLGMLYPLDVVFLIIGIFAVLKRPNRIQIAFLIWLFLSPLPATFSRDEVNAVRSLPMVFPLCWMVGVGLAQSWIFISDRQWWLKIPLESAVLVGYLGLVGYYLDMYYVVAPQKTAAANYYGYKQIVESVQRYRQEGRTVVVNQSYAQPYIYFLFYEKFDPATYQQLSYVEENPYGDVGLVPQVGDKLFFKPVNWSEEKKYVGNVVVGDSLTTLLPDQTSDEGKYQTTVIKYPNGEEAFRVVNILSL